MECVENFTVLDKLQLQYHTFNSEVEESIFNALNFLIDGVTTPFIVVPGIVYKKSVLRLECDKESRSVILSLDGVLSQMDTLSVRQKFRIIEFLQEQVEDKLRSGFNIAKETDRILSGSAPRIPQEQNSVDSGIEVRAVKPKRFSDRTYTSLKSVIGFGKYKDKPLHWVAKKDGQYIKWMLTEPDLANALESLPEKHQRNLADIIGITVSSESTTPNLPLKFPVLPILSPVN